MVSLGRARTGEARRLDAAHISGLALVGDTRQPPREHLLEPVAEPGGAERVVAMRRAALELTGMIRLDLHINGIWWAHWRAGLSGQEHIRKTT